MAGLIDTAIDQQDPLSSVVGMTPSTRELNPQTDTVAGQVNKVIADDSPLMQGARTRAAQTANNRGLLNSSMAVQAGEAATYDAALPIATADAAIHNTQGQINQAAQNRGAEVTAAAQNAGSLLAAQGKDAKELQQVKGEQAQGLADTEALYKTLLQSNASAAQNFSQVAQNIAAITADAGTSAEFKAAAIATQREILQNALSVIGSISNLDLSALLTFD